MINWYSTAAAVSGVAAKFLLINENTKPNVRICVDTWMRDRHPQVTPKPLRILPIRRLFPVPAKRTRRRAHPELGAKCPYFAWAVSLARSFDDYRCRP